MSDADTIQLLNNYLKFGEKALGKSKEKKKSRTDVMEEMRRKVAKAEKKKQSKKPSEKPKPKPVEKPKPKPKPPAEKPKHKPAKKFTSPPGTCKLSELDSCLDWHRFKTIPETKTHAELAKRDRKLMGVSDCGAGAGVDCAFLSMASALSTLTKDREKNKTLQEAQMELRHKLWNQVSQTQATLAEFVNLYYKAKEEKQDYHTMITEQNWNANDNKREIQIYIEGGADINRQFQGDTDSFKWLFRDPELRQNRVRVMVVAPNRSGVFMPEFKISASLPPIDEFEPVIDEQTDPQFDKMKYIVLWHQGGNHWRLIGMKKTKEDETYKRLLSFEELPTMCKNVFLRKIKPIVACEKAREPDGSVWHTFSEFKKKENSDTTILEKLATDLKITPLWQQDFSRLCIETEGFEDGDDEKRFGQLLFESYKPDVSFKPEQKRCDIVDKYVQMIDTEELNDLNDHLVRDRRNWQFSTKELYQNFLAKFDALLQGIRPDDPQTWAPVLHFLQWKMLWHQPTFRMEYISRFPFTTKKEPKQYNPELSYKKKRICFIKDKDTNNIYYFKSVEAIGVGEEPEIDFSTKADSTNGWRLIAIQFTNGETQTWKQAKTLMSTYKIPEEYRQEEEQYIANNECKKYKMKYKIPGNEQYLWNYKEKEWKIRVLDKIPKPNIINNVARKAYIEKVFQLAKTSDDSFFKLNGPWYSLKQYREILADLRLRLATFVSGDIRMANKLVEERSAWVKDKRMIFDYKNDVKLHFERLHADDQEYLDEFKRMITDPVKGIQFRLNSDIVLPILLHLLSVKTRTMRHLIIFKQDKRNAPYYFQHIVPDQKLTQPLKEHRFAIWIERYIKTEVLYEKDEKTIIVEKKCHLLAWHPETEDTTRPGQFVERWQTIQHTPKWIIHSLFNDKQLMTFK
jgi:hypothetical protein